MQNVLNIYHVLKGHEGDRTLTRSQDLIYGGGVPVPVGPGFLKLSTHLRIAPLKMWFKRQKVTMCIAIFIDSIYRNHDFQRKTIWSEWRLSFWTFTKIWKSKYLSFFLIFFLNFLFFLLFILFILDCSFIINYKYIIDICILIFSNNSHPLMYFISSLFCRNWKINKDKLSISCKLQLFGNNIFIYIYISH